VLYTNAQLRASIPVLYDRFHYGLDLLEAEIINAKTTLRRDLEVLRQQRRVREEEERSRKEKENTEKSKNENEVVLIEDDTPPAAVTGATGDGGGGDTFANFLDTAATASANGGGPGEHKEDYDDLFGPI
jgi:hypothetical protein